jgi:hypothetical protein
MGGLNYFGRLLMVRSASQRKSTPPWHEGFLNLLPAVRLHSAVSFRQLDPEAKAEAIQNCIVNAMIAYLRLYELGKVDLAYAGPLGSYAVAQTKAGRTVGSPLNCKDVSSPYAQKMKRFELARLDHYDRTEECWEELVVESRAAGPAEVAITRLDFKSWLRSLPTRLRRIAKVLATGETTKATAKQFNLTEGRISQIRRLLADNYRAFIGEPPLAGGAVAAA